MRKDGFGIRHIIEEVVKMVMVLVGENCKICKSVFDRLSYECMVPSKKLCIKKSNTMILEQDCWRNNNGTIGFF